MKLDFLQNEKFSAVWAPLFLRIALGTVFIAHGSQKMFGAFDGHGIGGVIKMVTAMGFTPPVLWAWLLAFTEFFGGLAILFGLLTRLAAAGISFVMLVAIFKVHFKNGFLLSGGGYEYPFVLLMIALSLIFSGAGRISLDWLIYNYRVKNQ